jgi:hypothetical protein
MLVQGVEGNTVAMLIDIIDDVKAVEVWQKNGGARFDSQLRQ